jgi:hypothetical protein
MLVAIVLASSAKADVRLPALFSDHMVLQSGTNVAVWGWAAPGEQVRVSIAGQTKSATAGADGKWQLKLDPLSAGGPHELTVQAANAVAVKDVLVGEVWLGSGQSNMAMTVDRSQNFEQEQPAAAQFPQIRMFTVPRVAVPTPQAECKGKWEISAPDTVGHFSAAAYFFGRKLHQDLKVPVGLINSSVGGTDIAAWTSEEPQLKVPGLKAKIEAWAQRDKTFDLAKAKVAYEKQLAAWNETAKKAREAKKQIPRQPRPPVESTFDPNRPTNLYNGMIEPLIPYTIHGAIWYQGEHNSGSVESATLYGQQLPLLVADWRARWGYDFPFAWVQLPNFDRPGAWPVTRESMLKSLAVKKTGMAITIDVGDPKDIHPKNKQEVGRRLALWALADVYGKPGVSSGPLPAGHEIRGNQVMLSFTHTDGGLTAKGGQLRGFVIAGQDLKWQPAQAKIEGDKVVVFSPDVKQPVAVRYAWSDNPDCNLYNGAGLPASPFRTDTGNP